MSKKRFVQVGVGGRARFFYEALDTDYSDPSLVRRELFPIL